MNTTILTVTEISSASTCDDSTSWILFCHRAYAVVAIWSLSVATAGRASRPRVISRASAGTIILPWTLRCLHTVLLTHRIISARLLAATGLTSEIAIATAVTTSTRATPITSPESRSASPILILAVGVAIIHTTTTAVREHALRHRQRHQDRQGKSHAAAKPRTQRIKSRHDHILS
jgi:hypothetical protein